MRRALAALAAAVLLLPPAGSAQSLEEELAEFHFERVVFTITEVSDEDGSKDQYVLANAENLVIEGEAARDLRHCIDGQECRVPALGFAAAGADRDGTVSRQEVENFAETVLIGVASRPEVRNFLQNLKALIKIDDKEATSPALTGLEIDEAEGSIDSTDRILLSVSAAAKYATVVPADTHSVWMRRSSTNFTIADEIVVAPGSNWRIVEDSVQPDSMRQFLGDGRFTGTQEEFESTEPLQFTVEYHKSNAATYFLLGSLSLLAVGGAGGFFWWRRRKV